MHETTSTETETQALPAASRKPWTTPKIEIVPVDEGTEDLGSIFHFFSAS